ncbi:hypothetical protein N7451_012355, partial [Penicillium sp. IBT 35674x]
MDRAIECGFNPRFSPLVSPRPTSLTPLALVVRRRKRERHTVIDLALSDERKRARLSLVSYALCLIYQYLALRFDEFFDVRVFERQSLHKNVILTDETAVVLLHRRGSYRPWRTKDEAVVRSCIRERWKGAYEFMFLGSSSYDKKGPYHCWLPETAADKRDSEKVIEELNAEIELEAQRLWELETG